jgi:hypothetical protein
MKGEMTRGHFGFCVSVIIETWLVFSSAAGWRHFKAAELNKLPPGRPGVRTRGREGCFSAEVTEGIWVRETCSSGTLKKPGG